ncbi:TipJ family phage tail tip protein [Moraxella bovis]|uniref:TipJ family phage tail tip protein n=1 Tax=Moraxella bovis TaxID=476 RepID=UPI0022262DF9|nr:phage tail protein [Moraxella bovis]UZA10061.1 phage tail protein [Moraxella bovis]UZA34508.1 phage tail protein [Moraxella bovis]
MIHGAKKKQPQPHRPHIAKDDLVSVERYQGLYGLCEGEIFGLADGGRSIRLDGTPIINASGQANFTDVSWEFRTGTNDQSYIKGFASVENETAVGVELRHDRPFVRAINNKDLSAVRVRLNFNALRQQHDNGDITGYGIEYAIDVQTDGGAFVQMLRTSARGKASSGFKRSHRIDLPKGKTWTIRVRRITPNRNSDLIADTMYIDALTEIIDAKLRYPNTALLALTYNAKTFSNIAKIAVRLKGKLIQVPSNYDPTARTYFGLWDGQFKMAYSNNPAWVFYDLCTHKRYGLGERLNGMVDKWRLYQIAQYCDEMVDDGKGGREPRFAINVYIQKADDAYRVLQNIASVFRGLSFWDGSQIVLDSDTPKDPVYTFSPANIVGEFVYQGTRSRDRHTVAKVAWDNPEHDYATEYEMVREESAIAKYGIRTLDINAFGCTSRGQAQRAGLWALKAEQLETRTVNFKTGLMGFIPQVGQIINIADNLFAGRAVSGRILSVNDTQITLDRTAGKVGDTLTINTDGTVKTAKIVSVHGDTLTVDTAVGQADDVWAIISDDLKLMQFRVLSIAQNDDATFDITALQYEHQKYDVVDNGAVVTPQPYTVLKATPIHAPKTVTITANTRTHQGQAITTLTINWEQVQGAAAYIVEWRKDDGNWQTMPKVAGQSVDIDGVYGGAYMARVRAVDSFDGESLATSSQLTAIAGKVGRPPRLANLTVQGILFGMNLGWSFNKGSEDTNFTEIEVSPDGRSNITTLGTFAYPTNKHEITGLQGNLTQFYRGRIVDKLGNTSDWTAWVSGTTSGDAGKVLDLISGQINGSHLDQTLRTPIAKIGDLQTAVDGVNAQLPTLNSQLATANRELQTAISNITTERNRINTAIRDITALQSANTAKTQELANLTRTVGSHTSAVRDLAVTTGDLSQKYSQLKTATDTANSEITAIKQTQAEQALSVERLGARFDNGNLFKANTATLGHFLDENDSGALKPWGSHRASDFIAVKTNTLYEVRAFDGNFSNLRVIWYDDDKNFVKGQIIARGGDYATFNSENASFVRISSYWTRTDNNVWQMQVAGLASDVNANLETLRQTLTDADIALSQQITAMDTAYKSADTDITARLAREETARANGDNANAQALRTLESTVNGIGGRVGTSEGKIASLERTTSDLNGAIATAQNELNARFDNLTVGGRNLLLNTQALNPLWTRPTSIENGVATFVATGRLLASTQQSDNVQALENGKVTISFTAKSNRDGRLHIRLRRFNTNNQLSDIAQYIAIDSREFKRYSLTLDYSKWTNQERVNFEIATYERAGFVCEVKLPKLEIGTIPTDWTPAPEDLQADIDAKASSASLDEFKRTQAQKDTATAQKLSTLQTTVNGQTTSIRNVERSVDGVRAIKAVTVDNNGVISGYGLMSELQNGRVTSQFGVNADSFFVGSPRNGKKPFATYTQPTVINGVRIPAGTYINTAFIANASITMAKIADSIQSDNYVAGRQGWRLFKDGRFELNNTFGDGSSLELNSKGLIVWYDKARGKKAVELGIFT